MGMQINTVLIHGVKYKQLPPIKDERGVLLHHMTESTETFIRFGEVYLSKTFPGVIKAWKKHKLMTQNMSVIEGEMKIVIYDDRADSATKGVFNVFLMDDDAKHGLLTIPPLLWYGFQSIGAGTGTILNVTDLAHTPEETERASLDQINFNFNG